jgi:hypothetical protein
MADTDTVILLGTISTWVAVILALAALVGVVGPWKALRAAYTDWNRALDEIHDTNEEYITKGYGIVGVGGEILSYSDQSHDFVPRQTLETMSQISRNNLN